MKTNHRQQTTASPMCCTEFETAIQEQLDQRLPLVGNRLLREHASTCESCNQLLNDFIAIESGLNQLCGNHLKSPANVELSSRRFDILNGVFASKRLGLGQRLPAFATAAMLLIACGWATVTQLVVPLSVFKSPHAIATATFSNQSNPNQSNPNQSNPNQSNPNQSNPNQSNPNQIEESNFYRAIALTPTVTLEVPSQKTEAETHMRTTGNRKSTTISREAHPETDRIRLRQAGNLILPPSAHSGSTNLNEMFNLNQMFDLSRIPATVSWSRIAGGLNPLQPYLKYSTEFPGLAPLASPVNMTLDLLQRSLMPSAKPVEAPIPNLQGFRMGNSMLGSLV